MLAMEAYIAGSSSALPPSSSSEEAVSKETFSMLQPLCSRLLELPLRRGQSDFDTSLLVSLRQALRDAPLQGLRVCLEYVLFPLQLLLDASVACRSQRHSKKENDVQSNLQSDPKSPKLHIADKIAEGVLGCVELLLLRCPVTSTSQLSVLLRKLTTAAMLSSDEASEEFRHAAVKILQRLFSGLHSCGRSFCGCKLSALPHSIISNEGSLKVDIVSSLSFLSQNRSEGQVGEDMGEPYEDCLIEFLQSENMSAAVGHLLSLFLQISENESLKGRIGSANLRIDAILTLRILILKVGAADALAFFLPGVASRLVKSLQSSKRLSPGVAELSYPSGAAGSSGAAEQSIRALSELLVLVLADERNRTTLEVSSLLTDSHARTVTLEGYISVETALETLRKASHASAEGKNAHLDLTASDDKCVSAMPTDSHTFQNVSVDSKGSNIFRVDRSKTWLYFTVKQIRTLLGFCFPGLCCHSAPSVRLAIAESAVLLMSTCRISLEGFMPTLLESLLAMACDDWPHVASAAHIFLTSLMVEKHDPSGVLRDVKSGLGQIICRLLERLPKAMYSGDENLCFFLSRQLLAAMYFAGPSGVSECIFQSPAATTQFVAVMAQCFSFNVAFVGTLQQLNVSGESSVGSVLGIIEVGEEKVAQSGRKALLAGDCTNIPSRISFSGELPTATVAQKLHQLPRLPPWFRQSGGCKFYPELAGILRLVGLSSMLGSGDARNLYVLIDELVAPLRCIPFDHHKDMYRDQFPGQWQRRAAASIAVLNEVFYGASGLWFHASCLPFILLHHHHKIKVSTKTVDNHDAGIGEDISAWHPWEDLAISLASKLLRDRIGDVLHEFTSDALWKLPVDAAFGMIGASLPADGHILKDNSFLQQVILEGIGVLAVSVGKLFEEQGFLGSVLYLLLERLGCTDHFVSSTADLVLHLVSSTCGYPSVRALIVASTDYIVDSLCRQLRHMDFFPNAPNMLVAVLRYTGAGQDLVPLLQEPMRSISLELEIPARQVHSGNTLLMLRALNEVVKAAKGESARMLETTVLQGKCDCGREFDDSSTMSCWDEITSDLKKSERTRQALQEIVISCLNSSSPLMASKDQSKCLLALAVTEVGMATMACLDALAKHEKEEKAKARNLTGHADDISDFIDAEPPKLLPTMHHVWPHLAACLKHAMPSVLIRASQVMAGVVSSCGGDFFARRFQKDLVPRFLTILCQGTGSQPKSDMYNYGNRKLLLNFQDTDASKHKDFAPASLLKVQEAVLACIRDVGKSKKSASALASSLEQLAGVVVGLACGVPVLQESATQTLIALSNIDADLIWILLADIANGGGGLHSLEVTPPGPMFPEASQLLPPFLSSQEALWMQISGRDITLNINSSKAWAILSRLESCKYEDTEGLDM